MNQPPVIEVKHLTKEYSLGTVTSLKDSLRHMLARLSGKPTWQRERFKALDDVSFTINQGEVVGIIGHNGAGKSTLLKHLASITKPTSGEVVVRGSIAPLIEVGAGINPELTGRENIFLNGAILGVPKSAIKAKLQEIIDFSELGVFIDTPVKRYSSGMAMKLGFSIATSLDADILIVDEVLAVGDLSYQRKCFDRMEALIKNNNKTVVLVSHNIRQIERLCTKVVMLDKGKIFSVGDPLSVANDFYRMTNKKTEENIKKASNIVSTGELELLSINIIDLKGNTTTEIVSGDSLRVKVEFRLTEDFEKPEIVVGTQRADFIYITAASTAMQYDRPDYFKGDHEILCTIKEFPVIHGTYTIRFGFLDQHRRIIFHAESLLTFTVTPKEGEAKQAGMRLIDLPTVWAHRK